MQTAMPSTKVPKTSVPQALAALSDADFIEEISKGIGLIGQSVGRLDQAAEVLAGLRKGQSATVLHALAEEEAAKALILLDAVRCPKQCQGERSCTLFRFRDHLAKGIYAAAVSWRYADLAEFRRYVDRCRKSLHLDGPNDVDWILPNEIVDSRQRTLYVDYRREITESDGDQFWIFPDSDSTCLLPYRRSDAARLVRAIVDVGASSALGLSIVASLWREFSTTDDTTFSEVRGRNIETLERLARAGACTTENYESLDVFVNYWLPPMWSLDLTLDRVQERQLREERGRHLAWRREQAARRDPPLTILRKTVLHLGTLFSAWQQEMDDTDKTKWQSGSGSLAFLNASFFEECAFKLQSYRKLTQAVSNLTKEARIDLAALAWFARRTGESWTQLHEHAIRMIGNDCRYEVGLGNDWIDGLHRWENVPPGS